jgi:hypothetical protein
MYINACMIFKLLTVPQIHPMEDVVIQEDKSLVITCFAQGDPYPMTSLLNISSNQTLGGEEIDVNQTMFVSKLFFYLQNL